MRLGAPICGLLAVVLSACGTDFGTTVAAQDGRPSAKDATPGSASHPPNAPGSAPAGVPPSAAGDVPPLVCVDTLPDSTDADGLTVGGTNYVMVDIPEYLANPTEATWAKKGVLHPVVGTLHQHRARVIDDLKAMIANGQRKLSLALWFGPVASVATDGVYMHVVDSSAGRLTAQHEKNLTDVITYAGCLGFNEVFVRFAPQAHAAPGGATGWDAWDQAQFQQNWEFIYNAHGTAAAAAALHGVKLTFDLSLELGGLEDHQVPRYAKTLWETYYAAFGKSDTLGYSIAFAPGRLASALAMYDATGARPDRFGFDIYDNEDAAMTTIGDELAAATASTSPLVILEAFANDALANSRFRAAKARLGLNLQTILQWPIGRASGALNFSVDAPVSYGAYAVP